MPYFVPERSYEAEILHCWWVASSWEPCHYHPNLPLGLSLLLNSFSIVRLTSNVKSANSEIYHPWCVHFVVAPKVACRDIATVSGKIPLWTRHHFSRSYLPQHLAVILYMIRRFFLSDIAFRRSLPGCNEEAWMVSSCGEVTKPEILPPNPLCDSAEWI